MRETCARVLAAALMTGAIAGVVAMSVLFGSPSEAGRPITAPPSSLERSVRVVALPGPRLQRTSVQRLVSSHHISRSSVRPAVATRALVIVQPRRAHTNQRRLASTKPKVAPVAPPAPAPQPAAEPAPAPLPEATRPQADPDHGNGHAFGHEQDHGKGHGGHED
jgi:hypothetical protein